MEQLAILVLNGDGNKLIGKTTTQPDIQAFLDNVPIYMVSEFFMCIVQNLVGILII